MTVRTAIAGVAAICVISFLIVFFAMAPSHNEMGKEPVFAATGQSKQLYRQTQSSLTSEVTVDSGRPHPPIPLNPRAVSSADGQQAPDAADSASLTNPGMITSDKFMSEKFQGGPRDEAIRNVTHLLKEQEAKRALYSEVPNQTQWESQRRILTKASPDEVSKFKASIRDIEHLLPLTERTKFRVEAQRLMDDYMTLPNHFRIVTVSIGRGSDVSGRDLIEVLDFDNPEFLPKVGKEFNPQVKNADGTFSFQITPNVSRPYYRDGKPDPRYDHLFSKMGK